MDEDEDEDEDEDDDDDDDFFSYFFLEGGSWVDLDGIGGDWWITWG